MHNSPHQRQKRAEQRTNILLWTFLAVCLVIAYVSGLNFLK